MSPLEHQNIERNFLVFVLSLCFQTLYSIAISTSVIRIFFSPRLHLLEDRVARGTFREVNMTYILDLEKKPLQLSVRIAYSLQSCGQPDVCQLILSRSEIKTFCRYQCCGSNNAFITRGKNK